MDAEKGIPLKIIRAVISRAIKRHPHALLRVTKNGLWMVRHSKHEHGFSSLFLDELLTPKERRAIEKARQTENDNLIDESAE